MQSVSGRVSLRGTGALIQAGPRAVRRARGIASTALALLTVTALSGCMSLVHSDEEMRARIARESGDGATAVAAPVTAPVAASQPDREPVFAEDTPTARQAAKEAKVADKAQKAEAARQARAAREAQAAQEAQAARQAELSREAYAHSSGLKGRKLLRACVEKAFAEMKSRGEGWGAASSLAAVQELPGVAAGSAAEQALERLSFAQALGMEGFLNEAADEVPLKFGGEKFKGQMPISDFFHRTLGSASFNTLEAHIYTALVESHDPAVQGLASTKSERLKLAVALAHSTDEALWAQVKRSEAVLRGGQGVALD